jgi:hypothetical protein
LEWTRRTYFMPKHHINSFITNICKLFRNKIEYFQACNFFIRFAFVSKSRTSLKSLKLNCYHPAIEHNKTESLWTWCLCKCDITLCAFSSMQKGDKNNKKYITYLSFAAVFFITYTLQAYNEWVVYLFCPCLSFVYACLVRILACCVVHQIHYHNFQLIKLCTTLTASIILLNNFHSII